MAWYRDLSECDYFGAGDRMVAVGWLQQGHDYETGPTPRRVYDRLAELLVNPYQPVALMGSHACDLCQYDGPAGSANLFIPGQGALYVAPELVLHYIAAHSYRPPEEFQAAVLACPPIESMSYKRAFLAAGGRAFLRRVADERAGAHPQTASDGWWTAGEQALDSSADFVGPAASYVALLWDYGTFDPSDLRALAQRVAASGCTFAVCGGARSALVEQLLDESFVMGSLSHEAPPLVTTAHVGESVRDVAVFFGTCAFAPGDRRALVHVGGTPRERADVTTAVVEELRRLRASAE